MSNVSLTLFTCPVCKRESFTAAELRQHWCRGFSHPQRIPMKLANDVIAAGGRTVIAGQKLSPKEVL